MNTLDPQRWPSIPLTPAQLGLCGKRSAPLDLVGSLPPAPRLAIVGSRAAHRRVLRALPAIVSTAAARGWSILSGGAIGIDGGAHRAALERRCPQLAVLPCGRDRVYPPGHARLFAALVEAEGGLLFAHPPGTETVRAMFASRNEIVVDLADAVLVAEASQRSGSTGTGRLALRRKVPLAALAGSPGCGVLIGAGAHPLPCPPPNEDHQALARVAEDVGAWLDFVRAGGVGPGPRSALAWPEHLRWLEAAVREAGPAGLAIDTLPDPDRAAVALLEAELLGLVCEASADRWVGL